MTEQNVFEQLLILWYRMLNIDRAMLLNVAINMLFKKSSEQ